MKTQLKVLSMYNEFKNLFADGLSKSAIARKTGHDRKTVRKYISMSEQELEHHLERISQRTKKLQRYEEFVRNRISNCIDCSAAQVDFGVSWMRDQHGNRVKVYFMLMVLSRSRQKFVFFTDQPVTTWFLILAMENAFVYFGGVPRIIVFDQDATILTSENYGELIFTLEFERYLNQRKFKVHMCRKADPQSKGKVENGVKYVKGNFLHGRTFQSMEQLNKESCQWLERTANAKVHGTTHLVPAEQWLIEKEHLQLFSGGEFKSVFHHLLGERKKHVSVSIGEYVPLMPGSELDQILLINPKQSAVSDYQNLLI